MTLYEIEGFLRGKCLPGDLLVGESTAEYIYRKLKERDALAADNVELKRANAVALNILNDEETMITSLWASSVHLVIAETPATDAAIENIGFAALIKLAEHMGENEYVTEAAGVYAYIEQCRKEAGNGQ